MKTSRVSALQFATGTCVEENLQTCLRMIELAALERPDLMVLPEFCNHISWYADQAQAWDVAVDIDGPFLQEIAKRASIHKCHIVVNVSLRRYPVEGPCISVTSILFSPDGKLLSESDKQTLMGHENDFFTRASSASEVVETSIGRLGIFPCRDGVTCETPRSLALRGAQIFCDSLNSFALDEAALHVPARAPENKVFLVSANKVGPLIPEDLLDLVSQETHIPVQYLKGAGESQIVAPDGEVLAKAPLDEEGVIVADIMVSDANQKSRPDGSDVFANRRPQLYQAIVSPPKGSYTEGGAQVLDAACYVPKSEGEGAIDEVVQMLKGLNKIPDVIVLPELFCFANGEVSDLSGAHLVSQTAISKLKEACHFKLGMIICTSLVIRGVNESGAEQFTHSAVIISHQGLLLTQSQLHATARHGWSSLGEQIEELELPWGKIAMLTGDDVCHPEIVKVAALKGIHVLLLPIDIQEKWESEYGLLSRAAENRVCLVACSRLNDVGRGMIATLERDFTIMTPWKERVFDGNINLPIASRQVSQLTEAQIHPIAASNKLMSANTDLLQDRPWRLCHRLVTL